MDKEYTIQNSVIFGLVMKKSNIAKKCIERVLNIKVKNLKYVETEKTEKLAPDIHGIRMDVYCENSDAVYNIEMQAYRVTDIGKRSRYYQDMMDMTILDEGKNYSELKKNIVIFICTFDPYGEGRHIYTFENRCIQDTDISLEDDTRKIVLNTKGKLDDIPKSLKVFLDYIETGVAQDDYTKEVDKAVVEIQNDERWRDNIMTVDQLVKDASDEAAEKAFLKGKEQESKQRREKEVSIVTKFVEEGKITSEVAEVMLDEFAK